MLVILPEINRALAAGRVSKYSKCRGRQGKYKGQVDQCCVLTERSAKCGECQYRLTPSQCVQRPRLTISGWMVSHVVS